MEAVRFLVTKNPEAGACSFYVNIKQRFCKMRTKPGALYCGEHRGLESGDSGTDRVPSQYDPNQYMNIHEK